MADPADIETVLARRELRASRRRWRFIAFVALAALVIVVAWRGTAWLARPENNPHIARIEITGVIAPDPDRLAIIEAIAEDSNVAAVIVSIDSPGGATAGGEELYESLRALAEAKPTVAVINQLGASAAYMTAIATDRIFARRLSVVGSIGVLYTHIDASALLDTIGIDIDAVTTGPLKAEPEIDEPMAPEVRRSLQALVDNAFDWFVGIVAERRGLDRATVLTLADGRVMTGQMGIETGLIDAAGGESEAIDWLEAERGVAADLPVLIWFPLPEDPFSFFRRAASESIAAALGLDQLRPLDGLTSVWHVAE